MEYSGEIDVCSPVRATDAAFMHLWYGFGFAVLRHLCCTVDAAGFGIVRWSHSLRGAVFFLFSSLFLLLPVFLKWKSRIER